MLRDKVSDPGDSWGPWKEARERRATGLIRTQPLGDVLPARVTVEHPALLEVIVDIGDFYWDPLSYNDLMDFESSLVTIEMSDSFVRDDRSGDDESSDERQMMHLRAVGRIDLDAIEKKLPLEALVALVRRKAVAVLLRVYDERGTLYGPRWLGEALFPDRTAVAGLLEPRWPDGLRPDVRYDMEECFGSTGLGRPWIPAGLTARVGVTDRWMWSTRAESEDYARDRANAYEFFPLLSRALTDTTSRFHLCHTGYGMNSWALVYEWVSPRMSVVTLTGWGGWFTSGDEAASRLRLMAADLAILEALSEALVDWPRDDNRLLLWSSEFAGSTGRWWQPDAERAPGRFELVEEAERTGWMPWDLENDDLGTTLGAAVRYLEYELAVDLGLLEYD